MTNTHLDLWERAQTTDPNYTKGFNRGGGFKGTSTNATYLAKRATEEFGPCGIGWGVKVLDEQIIEGHPLSETCNTKVHTVRVQLWYIRDGQRGEIEQYGQTTMVGKDSRGLYTDEEAPKKSITDAMTKCLSLLGFAADIHLGLYDDNKYVAELRREFAEGDKEPERAPPREAPAAQPQRDHGPRKPVAFHVKAMQEAKSVADLQKAFATAWRQHENPDNPKDKTPAQLKLKECYDKRAGELAAASEFDVGGGTDAELADGGRPE